MYSLSFINRTFNQRFIFVLVADGKVVRAYSEQTEGTEDLNKIRMTKPNVQVALIPCEMHDHQAIDSRNNFARFASGDGTNR